MSKYIPINRILLTLLIAIILMMAVFTYLYVFDNNPPIEFYNLPFPTDKKEYRAGDNIILTADYCRYTTVSYTLNMRFVDGIAFSVPETHRVGALPGCRVINFQIVTVPDNLPPGTYYLEGKNEYQVNFLANRLVEWTSQEFEVIP